ncbi:interferon-stimulated 20 kDa exonuclease-like 2 [Heptranchias perlo]|uniref:interferon-stimulated 20 kDa exonuclease-like 2 n=1 Tax=Heptranchias perlo TaxID=212740 RepID=UPI00355A5054
MSDLTLNLDFSTGAAQKCVLPNPKHKRFLRRRSYLERKGYLNKKQGARMPDARDSSQPPAWIAASQPGQALLSGFRAAAGVTNGPGARLGSGTLQNVCRDSQQWKLSPAAAPHHHHRRPEPAEASAKAGRPGPGGNARLYGREGALPPERGLLLSECQSGLPPIGQAAPAAADKPYKCVALDCEMVGTGQGGRKSELARCSVVGYDGDLVYDKYILPPNPITDYRTRWSGIRRQHMKSATPFKLAQKEILKILCGKVVIGHAVHNDFKALNYFHPQSMTRDTSKIPLLNRKAGFPEKESVSLKRLTKQLLHRDIQVGRQGHSSVEDARATMELYRLVEVQWEREAVAQPGQK